MLRPARSSRRDARPNSGVRQFGSELLDCDPPPCVCGSTKLVVTGLAAVSLSLGVAGDFGCKLRSRYLVLVLEHPSTLFVITRGSVSTLLWTHRSSSAGNEDLYSVRCRAAVFRG
jgi:hypothetical protein